MTKTILIKIIGKNWPFLIVTYTFLLIQAVLYSLTPLIQGMAIDNLVAISTRGINLGILKSFEPGLIGEVIKTVPSFFRDFSGLIWLSLLYICMILFGFLSRYWDTRLYSRLYQNLSNRIAVERLKETDSTHSKTIAHINLSREFINFLENDMANSLVSIIGLVGAIVAIFSLSGWAGLIAILAIGLLYILSRSFEKKSQKLYKQENELMEKQLEILQTGNEKSFFGYTDKIKQLQIKISDLQAGNFSILSSIILFSAIFGIVAFSLNKTFTPGVLASLFEYYNQLFMSIAALPGIVSKIAKLKDISERVGQVFDD